MWFYNLGKKLYLWRKYKQNFKLYLYKKIYYTNPIHEYQLLLLGSYIKMQSINRKNSITRKIIYAKK